MTKKAGIGVVSQENDVLCSLGGAAEANWEIVRRVKKAEFWLGERNIDGVFWRQG